MHEMMTSAEANIIDANQSYAVDGHAGGSYNPSAPIIIAGGKLQLEPIAGDIEFDEPFTEHAASSIVRVYPVHDFLIGTRFSVYTTAIALQQTDVASAGSASKVFNMRPAIGTLTEFSVQLMGAGGHAGLPGTMPSMTLVAEVPGVSSTTIIATTFDTDPADPAAYQVLHSITKIGLSVAIVPGTLYRLILTGETGVNSAVDLKFYSFTTTMTVTANYPG
jgi:hypothetical protein